MGCTPMCDLQDRQEATVSGTVRAVTLRPRVNVPALVIDLYDGSRTINLVWLGRRTIGGIEPGTYLRAHGRVTYTRGTPDDLQPVLRDRPAACPLTPRPTVAGRTATTSRPAPPSRS